MLNVVKRQLFLQNKSTFARCYSSIVRKKVQGFSDASSTWWDPEGSMKQMHLTHPHQISFVHQQLILKDGLRPEATTDRPLTGYKILDVGCGVGVNSERLALLGAEVTGLDPVSSVIREAERHAPRSSPNLKLEYVVSTCEEHRVGHSGLYDALLVFFILEHIRNRQLFIDNCLALLKPNGSLLIGNVSRSLPFRFYSFWHRNVTGLFEEYLQLAHSTHITKSEVVAMVNKGHPCELKGHLNLYWPLDGNTCRVTKSERHILFNHFVKKT